MNKDYEKGKQNERERIVDFILYRLQVQHKFGELTVEDIVKFLTK